MKNKVLITIGYLVGIMWIVSACAIDSESLAPAFINLGCTLYLGLFSYANNWWNGKEDDYDEESKESLDDGDCTSEWYY